MATACPTSTRSKATRFRAIRRASQPPNRPEINATLQTREVGMKLTQSWRMALLCLVFACPLLGLFAASLAATDTKKKAAESIVVRFDKAKPDDYLDEGLCKDCHENSHKSWQNSP